MPIVAVVYFERIWILRNLCQCRIIMFVILRLFYGAKQDILTNNKLHIIIEVCMAHA